MTHSSEGRSNGITTDELRQMLGPKSAARLSEKTMGELAHEINGFRWPEDPPSKLGDPGHVPILEMDDDSFWDFREAFGAATTLRDSLDKCARSLRSCMEARGRRKSSEIAEILIGIDRIYRIPFRSI